MHVVYGTLISPLLTPSCLVNLPHRCPRVRGSGHDKVCQRESCATASEPSTLLSFT